MRLTDVETHVSQHSRELQFSAVRGHNVQSRAEAERGVEWLCSEARELYLTSKRVNLSVMQSSC